MKSVKYASETFQPETDKDKEFTELKGMIAGILNSSEEFVMDLIQKVGQEIEGSVKANSELIANRLIALKNEMSVGKHVREHPWRWMGIAAVAGFSLRLLAAPRPPRTHRDSEGTPVVGPSMLAAAALPLISLAIEEIGSGFIKNLASKQNREEHHH